MSDLVADLERLAEEWERTTVPSWPAFLVAADELRAILAAHRETQQPECNGMCIYDEYGALEHPHWECPVHAAQPDRDAPAEVICPDTNGAACIWSDTGGCKPLCAREPAQPSEPDREA